MYTINEGSGDTNVRFGKVMGQATELNLTVMVDFDNLPQGVINGNMYVHNHTGAGLSFSLVTASFFWCA